MVVVMAGMVLFGCTENHQEENRSGIKFLLTDMPGVYQEVNIDVKAINVIANDSLIKLETNQGVYNLLKFVNGKDTLLVDDEMPSGFVSQVRLILGEDNTVLVDGELHDLKTPSAQQSGLKLNIHDEFLPGEAYTYVIDFVVEKSIVETGNGNYNLKPVIRVFTEAITGSIEGIVSPVEARPFIEAKGVKDTVVTDADSETGIFKIRGLTPGTYTLGFKPQEGFRDTLMENISVMAGQATIIDTMFIQ